MEKGQRGYVLVEAQDVEDAKTLAQVLYKNEKISSVSVLNRAQVEASDIDSTRKVDYKVRPEEKRRDIILKADNDLVPEQTGLNLVFVNLGERCLIKGDPRALVPADKGPHLTVHRHRRN